jgi:sulfopyruvate decarboxylase TPP-binding subunit
MLVLQNTGLLEAGDAFRGTLYNMGIPVVMVVGYRGYASLEPGAERIDTAASFCEPTLRAWNIPYYMLRSGHDCGLIATAAQSALQASLPAAVLYPGELR